VLSCSGLRCLLYLSCRQSTLANSDSRLYKTQYTSSDQGRPEAPPATQNESLRGGGGAKIRKLGTKFIFV